MPVLRSFVLTLVVLSAACSSKQAPPDAGGGPPTSPTGAADGGPDGATPTAAEVSGDDAAAPPDADPRVQRLEALAALQVEGMTLGRKNLQRELVTLQLDTSANAKGQVASVELTVVLCDPCVSPTVADLEAGKEMLLQQIGDLHAKNPDLVFEVKALDLAPMRTATTVYARSYVDDGTTRASVHTLESHYADNGFGFRFQAYPRGGFPTSAAELESVLSRAELEAAVQRVFVAAAAVLWPPVAPE